MNQVIVAGRVVPEEPYFDLVGEKQSAFFRFHLAVPGTLKGGPKEFRIRCVAYGELATKLYGTIAPETFLCLEGHLQTRILTTDQKPRWVAEVVGHRAVPLSKERIMNLVFLSGSLVDEPPYFDFVGPEKQPFLRFHVAVPNESESGPKMSYIRCVAYDENACNLYDKLPKVAMIIVRGHLQVRALPQGQKPRWIMEVVVDEAEVIE